MCNISFTKSRVCIVLKYSTSNLSFNLKLIGFVCIELIPVTQIDVGFLLYETLKCGLVVPINWIFGFWYPYDCSATKKKKKTKKAILHTNVSI